MRQFQASLSFAVCLLTALILSGTHAQSFQYCEKTNYSAQQITDAVNASTLRDDLKSTSCTLGGLGRFESGGNKGIDNGSCCTGIFQLNGENVRNAGYTKESYGCASLQDQADAWARLTNIGYNTSAVRTLSGMTTFDGQKVDASFIAACIQLGPGNCQKMIDGGTCGSWSDSNGTTICDMARQAKANADPLCDNNQTVQCGPGDFSTAPVAANATQPTASTADLTLPASAG